MQRSVIAVMGLLMAGLILPDARAQEKTAQPPRPKVPESAFLPIPEHEPAQRFGVATHLRRLSKGWTPDLVPMIRAMGVSALRDDEPWASVEKEKGIYKFSPVLEEGLVKAQTLQMEPLLILLYENPLYGKDIDAQAFARYANALIERQKGRVKYFELWNEPDNFYFRKHYGGEWNGTGKDGKDGVWLQKFADFIAVVATEIKKQHPEVKLIGYSSIAPSTHRMFQYPALWKNLDILSIHPYPMRMPPEVTLFGGKENKERDGIDVADEDRSFVSLIRRYREGLQKIGRGDMPIWITEIGYTTAQIKTKNLWQGVTENAQAIYNARLGILAAGNGIERTFFYDFYSDGKNAHEVEENYGLVRADYTPKPSYFAIQQLCSLMPGDTRPTTVPTQIERLWPRPNPSAGPEGSPTREYLEKPQSYAFVRPDGKRVVFFWQPGRIFGDAQEELANITLTMPKGEVIEVGRVASRQKLSPKTTRTGDMIQITEVPYGADPVYIVLK